MALRSAEDHSLLPERGAPRAHEGTGRGTTPALQWDEGAGPRWLPGSGDIVDHLYAEYGADR
ncbi:MAG: hypothetical protein AAFU79_31535 [Myxococcota bacterium]